MHWLEQPAVKWVVPIPMLVLMAPIVWWFFRSTWRQLDADALALRRELAERGEIDYRPMVALTLVALVLTFQEYYGRPDFYSRVLHDVLERWQRAHPGSVVDVSRYDELYGRLWWGMTRIGGYFLPVLVWPLFFRRDKLLDFGLRGRGFRTHAWIYALCVVVMVPRCSLVSRQKDFADYYPIYKEAGRSWLDFFAWEAVYLAQFFGLEMFFRGFWLRALRSFGSGAIWSMVVPYCMIHYGKPYLESSAAIIAGVVLGSLAMRTHSIYAGFLVHATVAVLNGRARPLPAWVAAGILDALGPHAFHFFPLDSLIWVAWGLALAVLAIKVWRSWPQLAAAFRSPS